MKKWLLAGGLLAAVALAVSWGLGSGSAPSVPEAAAAPEAGVDDARAAPLGAVAVVLSHARATPTPAPRPSQAEGACGPSGEPCGDDSVCLDGGCVSTACGADGGGRCALSDGRVGTCCGARCVDFSTDRESCGKCGSPCQAGLDCVAGQCRAQSCAGQMAGTPCGESGQPRGACCRGACVTPSSWADDTANCGGCAHACAPGLTCQQGACVDPATGAPPGWTCLDPRHACPADMFCVVDGCFPRTCGDDGDGLLCPGAVRGTVGHCCGGRCADLFSDPEACGACGVRCAGGQSCQAGACVGP
ncbi:MAG TPA: hypothetical protein VMB50_13860 [Myxococcales bacterium]|nr:hypothetical protein [Myxococcales bacterium]